MSLQRSTIVNKECLNLTEISFRNCSFMTSAQTDGANGTIQQFNLSHIFLAPKLSSINLSGSNVLVVITDEEVSAFCEKLKAKEEALKFFGIAGVCKGIINCRKYNRMLQAIGEGYKGHARLRVEKLDISYNILLGRTLTQYVLPFVKTLKMKMNHCEDILMKFK